MGDTKIVHFYVGTYVKCGYYDDDATYVCSVNSRKSLSSNKLYIISKFFSFVYPKNRIET